MKSLFRKGNRLYTATCLWLMLVATAHTSALFNAVPEEFEAAIDEMRLATLDTGTPLNPSLFEAVAGAWIQVGVLLAGMALLNLVALASSGGDARVKRALVISNLIVFVPMTILFIVIPVPPPLVAFGVASLMFGLDLRYSRAKSEPEETSSEPEETSSEAEEGSPEPEEESPEPEERSPASEG